MYSNYFEQLEDIRKSQKVSDTLIFSIYEEYNNRNNPYRPNNIFNVVFPTLFRRFIIYGK